jgi:hypothetical protein
MDGSNSQTMDLTNSCAYARARENQKLEVIHRDTPDMSGKYA